MLLRIQSDASLAMRYPSHFQKFHEEVHGMYESSELPYLSTVDEVKYFRLLLTDWGIALTRLHQNNLKLKASKCEFFKSLVT